MSLNELSLPADVPWKRIGASHDMIADNFGYLDFPQKWRSSLALFYHEPDPAELPEDYCKRRITYLKVVATLSSHHVGGQEASVLDKLRSTYAEFATSGYFSTNVAQVYPCFGALLHVGVFPDRPGVAIHDYPYIAAFQPRKREMYEALSETGEYVSQSATRLNVSKSATNSDSVEEYDLSLGGGGGSAVFGLASWTADQKQVGTIKRNDNQYQDVRSTDSSRDKRESHSYTSNINQIHSLLAGFHLGTNRALFFLTPRPHIVNSTPSFLRGLRKLEGIQEFFLIVNRPDSLSGLCFEMALETAHGHMFPAYSFRLVPLSSLYIGNNLGMTPSALGLNTTQAPLNMWTRLAYNWNKTPGFVRAIAQGSREGWLWGLYPGEVANLIYQGDMSYQQWDDVQRVTELLPEIGLSGVFTEDIAVLASEFEYFSGDFFVAGRRLMACGQFSPQASPSASGGATTSSSSTASTGTATESSSVVAAETSSEKHISKAEEPSILYQKYLGNRRPAVDPNRTSAREINTLNEELAIALAGSVTSRDRVPYGKLTFLDSEVALNSLAHLLSALGKAGIKDRNIGDVPEVARLTQGADGRTLNVKRLVDLAGLSTEEIAVALKLPHTEAACRRRSLIVSALEALDVETLPKGARMKDIRAELTMKTLDSQTRLRIEASAGLGVERAYPKARSGISKLFRMLGRVFVGD